MLDLDRFIADCRAARAADRSSKTICEVVKRAVSDPAALLQSLGEPDRAGIKEIYRSPDLSILNVVWAPHMTVMPHNHHMWAVIGVYGGREDNIFWRRIAAAGERQIEAAGACSLGAKDVRPFGHQPDVQIHRRNPHLWRRFVYRSSQRMGPRDAFRAALRWRARPPGFRGSQPAPRCRSRLSQETRTA